MIIDCLIFNGGQGFLWKIPLRNPPPDHGAFLAWDRMAVFNVSGRKHDAALGWTVAASTGPVLGPKMSRVTLVHVACTGLSLSPLR